MNHPDILIHFLKSTYGGGLATLGWIGTMLADVQDVAPDLIWKAGSTGALTVGLTYAVVHLWRALRQTESARINDRDEFIKMLKEDAKEAHASREKLHGVMDRYSESLEKLSNALERAHGDLHIDDPHAPKNRNPEAP